MQDGGDIPRSEILDITLPVHKPYFVRERKGGSGSDHGAASKVGSVDGAFDGVRATWIGHATILAELGNGTKAIADPMFSARASPLQVVGPRRYRPPACKVSELPESLNAVVISHNHYDHLVRKVRHISIKNYVSQIL